MTSSLKKLYNLKKKTSVILKFPAVILCEPEKIAKEFPAMIYKLMEKGVYI